MPRVVAVEYPYGRPVGEVGDAEGQRAVLLDTIRFMETAGQPGEMLHLPYEWPEAPQDADWHPPEVSPAVKLFLGEIKKAAAKKRKPKA